jgi:hypothetical protein
LPSAKTPHDGIKNFPVEVLRAIPAWPLAGVKVLSPAAQNKNGMVTGEHHPVFCRCAQ